MSTHDVFSLRPYVASRGKARSVPPLSITIPHKWSFAESTGIGYGDDSPPLYNLEEDTKRLMEFACRYWYHLWQNRGKDHLTPPYISMAHWHRRLARFGVNVSPGQSEDDSCDQSDSSE